MEKCERRKMNIVKKIKSNWKDKKMKNGKWREDRYSKNFKHGQNMKDEWMKRETESQAYCISRSKEELCEFWVCRKLTLEPTIAEHQTPRDKWRTTLFFGWERHQQLCNHLQVDKYWICAIRCPFLDCFWNFINN